VSRLLVAQRALTVPGWAKDALWRRAQAVPSLDLRFADNKSIVDAVTGQSLVTFTRASSGTFVDSAGVLQTAAVDVPRFDHNPTTGESLGLLVEEARTNLLLRSEELDNNTAWQRNGATLPTVTANAGVAPNGTTTADLWTRSIATSNFITQTTTKAASTIQYTYSIFVKQAVGNFCALRCQGLYPNKVDVVFNISSGAIHTPATVAGGTFTGPSAFITAYPNGWYRLTVTATSDTATFHECLTSFSSNGVVIDGSDSVSNSAGFLWGAQLEAGAFPTSYIPTTTATATRSADVASITGSAFSSWYRQDEGTVFTDGFQPRYTAQASTLCSINLSTGPFGDRLQVYMESSTPRTLVTTGGVNQAALDLGSGYNAGVTAKLASSYLVNNFAGSFNAGTPAVDSLGTVPTVNRLEIGAINLSAGMWNGTIRRLVYWGQRLPNNVLQAITQ